MSREYRGRSFGHIHSVDDRTLPPIREMFANELNLPLRQDAHLVGDMHNALPLYESPHRREALSQRDYAHKRETYVFPPSRQVTRGSKQLSRSSGSPSSHCSSPSQASNASSRSEKSQGGSHQAEVPGYSYSVLRASGTSGALVNATPPSERPQGILRQTAVCQTEQEEDFSKRHKCENCGKRFNMPSHLEIHSRTHTAQRPYACEWPSCDRTFSVRSNMVRHFRAHCTRERPKSESDDDLYMSQGGTSRSSRKYSHQHPTLSQHHSR